MSLPSTMIKTIYLFFDLPPGEETSRRTLNDLITDMMERLAGYTSVFFASYFFSFSHLLALERADRKLN